MNLRSFFCQCKGNPGCISMTVFPLYIPSRQVADKDLAQQQQLALPPSRAPMSACPIVNGSWRGEKLDWVLPPHHAVFQQYLGGQSHGRGLGLSSKRCFSADSVGFPGSLHLQLIDYSNAPCPSLPPPIRPMCRQHVWDDVGGRRS